MGDMADFALDCAADDCEDYDRFSSGYYCPQEAYDRGFTNEFGGESRGAKGWNTLFKSKYQLKCRTCGATNVYWHQYPSGKWFLFTQGANSPHKCLKE